MLLNRKYIGEYKFASVVVPNGIPAIIDEDLFERIKRMETKKLLQGIRQKTIIF